MSVSSDECRLMKLISNKIRFKILKSLANGEKCVMEIVRSVECDQTTVSHNLSLLSECGLVISRKSGKMRFYKLRISPLRKIIRELDGLLNLAEK